MQNTQGSERTNDEAPNSRQHNQSKRRTQITQRRRKREKQRQHKGAASQTPPPTLLSACPNPSHSSARATAQRS